MGAARTAAVESRCDALAIITGMDKINRIRLPELSHTKATEARAHDQMN